MSTSYADSAQAREWDRRYDDYGRPKAVQLDQFHDYDAANPEHSQRLDDRRRLQAEERKASAIRIKAAVEQIGDFFGCNEVKK
jgi:hypothetical protein